MLVTGSQIRRALRRERKNRSAAEKKFTDSLKTFEGEEKVSPFEAMQQYQTAERRIADLQVLQTRYNLAVTVKVDGAELTLQDAVKQVSGFNRAETLWVNASSTKKPRRGYVFNASEKRSVDEIYAQRTVSIDECIEQAQLAGDFASQLKDAIGVGNATPLDLSVTPFQEEALLANK